MPTNVLKQASDIIAPVIQSIINKSLREGAFPKECKKAIVRPLLKKPNMDTLLKNYRPVSNLSYISKLIEKAVGTQVTKHMQSNRTSEVMQSAYKANHSTETAIIWIFNKLLTELDNNHAVLVSLLDVSAAFDTVDHEILLKRLRETHGISGQALNWFASYLADRSMQVCVNGEYSKEITLDVSLPQGSQLGPRLYSDYTQPIGRLIRILEIMFHGYADDSQLLRPVTSPTDLSNGLVHLSSSINSIGKWMFDNKLKLNPDKTEFLVISSKRNQPKYDAPTLVLDDNAVPKVESARNLGVEIDSTLQLDAHIANITRISYFYIGWIMHIRKYISQDTTKSLVHAFILSRLDYCNCILVGLPKKSLDKLQRVMNACARLIMGKRKYDHISDSLQELHWLPVNERSEYKILTITYKALHNMAPEYLSNLISLYSAPRALRSQDKLLLKTHKFRNNYGARSFKCMAPKLWNELPFSLRSAPSFHIFKKNLKTHLFRKAYFSKA